MAKRKKKSKIHLDITAEKRQKLESYHCTIEAGIAMIGGKYKVMILYYLCLIHIVLVYQKQLWKIFYI